MFMMRFDIRVRKSCYYYISRYSIFINCLKTLLKSKHDMMVMIDIQNKKLNQIMSLAAKITVNQIAQEKFYVYDKM